MHKNPARAQQDIPCFSKANSFFEAPKLTEPMIDERTYRSLMGWVDGGLRNMPTLTYHQLKLSEGQVEKAGVFWMGDAFVVTDTNITINSLTPFTELVSR